MLVGLCEDAIAVVPVPCGRVKEVGVVDEIKEEVIVRMLLVVVGTGWWRQVKAK